MLSLLRSRPLVTLMRNALGSPASGSVCTIQRASTGAFRHTPQESGLATMFGSALLVQSRGFRFKSRLGRRTNIRWGMMRGLLNDLVEYERVLTTEARAKELVRMSDRVITYGKRGTLRARSWARRFLTKDHTIAKVFTTKGKNASGRAAATTSFSRQVFAERYKDKQGCYTRYLKTYQRQRDTSPMAYVEMVNRPSIKMPKPLLEQHKSVVPGRDGRKTRAGRFDLGTAQERPF